MHAKQAQLYVSHLLFICYILLLYLRLCSNQSLVEVISEHHHHRHFLEILMQVTELVVKKEEEESERRPTVQVPACTSTLTRFLYL